MIFWKTSLSNAHVFTLVTARERKNENKTEKQTILAYSIIPMYIQNTFSQIMMFAKVLSATENIFTLSLPGVNTEELQSASYFITHTYFFFVVYLVHHFYQFSLEDDLQIL